MLNEISYISNKEATPKFIYCIIVVVTYVHRLGDHHSMSHHSGKSWSQLHFAQTLQHKYRWQWSLGCDLSTSPGHFPGCSKQGIQHKLGRMKNERNEEKRQNHEEKYHTKPCRGQTTSGSSLVATGSTEFINGLQKTIRNIHDTTREVYLHRSHHRELSPESLGLRQ